MVTNGYTFGDGEDISNQRFYMFIKGSTCFMKGVHCQAGANFEISFIFKPLSPRFFCLRSELSRMFEFKLSREERERIGRDPNPG